MPEPEPPPPIYANVASLTTGPFDVVMDFGFKTPEQAKKGSPDFEIVARIAMSVSHAKSMLPLLAKLIAQYEQQFGPVPAPGFDDQAKG